MKIMGCTSTSSNIQFTLRRFSPLCLPREPAGTFHCGCRAIPPKDDNIRFAFRGCVPLYSLREYADCAVKTSQTFSRYVQFGLNVLEKYLQKYIDKIKIKKYFD
jgi:hypothetical protein